MDNFRILFGKYVYILAAVALLGGGSLFVYLESIGLEIECEDKVCEQGVECSIDCSVYNPTYTSKYLYNYDNWKITFTPEIEEFNLYAKYYGKWRFTNFTKETRFPNIPDARKYVFVFPRRTTKYFQLRVVLNSTQRIKFSFGVLDPLIVGYDYIYENLSKQVPVYTKVCTPTFDAKNSSHIEDCVIKTTYKTEYYDGEKIGVDISGEEVLNPNVYVNEEKGTLSESTVPWGDRNFEDPALGQGCRSFEIQKRLCKETDLLK